MKIEKYFVIILILTSNIFYAQEAEIIYKSIYFDDPSVKMDKNFQIKVSREINDMQYLLRYTKKQSFFEGLPHVPHDKFMAKMATGVTQSNVDWYQYPNEKQSYHNKKIDDSIYRVKYEDRMPKWNLHNKKKEIDGYVCYKATIDHTHHYTEDQFTIEAWYTPEIPVPYGPVGYGGLPGLILELKRSHVVYIAQEVTLNPKGGIKNISDLKPGRLIDADEKRKLQQKARKVTED